MFNIGKVFTSLVIFLALSISTCLSQTAIPAIKYLGVEHGLSNNIANSLYIDHFGFVWIGTYDGLNRYDGYNFKVFRNEWGIDNSLINNHITVLNGDTHGRVWIGTQKGISYYSYADSRFHKLFYIENGKRNVLLAAVNAIAINAAGTIFIATDGGLFSLKKGKVNAERILLAKTNNLIVKTLCADGERRLWLSLKDHGLCSYDVASKEIEMVKSDVKNITCLLNTAGNWIWVGTEKGLLKYDKGTKAFSSCKGYTERDNIMSFMLDKQQKLWIATDGGGVVVYDTRSNQANHLPVGKEKGFLSSNSVAQVYEDKESRKWIATLRGGINVIDQQRTQFQGIKKDPLKSNSLVNNFVLSFAEDEHQNVWIGTDGGGLSVWNPKKNSFTNYEKTNDPGSVKSNFITSILNDADNNIWVASFSGGIDRFDKRTGRFLHYSCFNDVKGVEEVNLWKLYQDRSRNIWAGTTRGGALYRYNKQTDKFELFDNRLQDIHSLFQDSKGQLWGGNYTDLIRIDISHKKHQFVKVGFSVRAIVEDEDNHLWIGTEGGGLMEYDPVSGGIKRYLEKDGLPSNTVLNLLKDEKGNLWCSTYKGLSKFSIRAGKFKNYYTSDGLSSNQFNYNAALKLSDGSFLFGGIEGFNRFFPGSIKENKRIPKIVLTDFRINNVPLDEDPHYSDVSVVNLGKISIPYNAAMISVSYAALEFSFQDQISYAYYLQGWDRDWNYVNKLNTAYYSRLNEGGV